MEVWKNWKGRGKQANFPSEAVFGLRLEPYQKGQRSVRERTFYSEENATQSFEVHFPDCQLTVFLN